MFRVGEKIECVRHSQFTGLTVGKSYDVWKCDDSLRVLQVMNDNHELIWVGFAYFEKMSPKLYNIGVVKQYVDEKGGE